MTAQRYWQETRAPRYSLLFALPLLLAYEALAFALARPDGSGVRNGADVLLKAAFVSLLGDRGPLVFELLLIGVGVALVARDFRSHGGTVSKGVFAVMLAEAAVLALVCGVVVGGVTSRIVGATGLALGPIEGTAWPTRLMLSLGAGLYEELLFRVILVGAIAYAGRRVLGLRPAVAGTIAVVIGALAFSTLHYLGPYGDRLAFDSFLFRALAGVFFSALYLLRGFGITAWTHALYDVFVLL